MQVERIPTDGIHLATEREQDITGSGVGALFGVHPYATELQFYAKHSGTVFPAADPENKILRRGRWCEPAVAKAVGERHPELRIEPAKIYLRDPILRLGAHPDFFIHGDPRGDGVLETKTASPQVYDRDLGRRPRGAALDSAAGSDRDDAGRCQVRHGRASC